MTTSTCPRCGKPLASDAPGGLCAACLLAASAESLASAETLASGSAEDDLPTMTSGATPHPRPGDASTLQPDSEWGPYRIGRLLGRGGMGEVYEAEHVPSGRRVALKILRHRLQTQNERARFLREGQLAASVSHPHTVYIFGSEEIEGTPVISMELLPGGTLKDRVVAHGPMSPDEAVAAILDLIGGLDAAAAAGILHRDIKPSNCFVDRDGVVNVGDFGLSISTLARDVHQQLVTSGFEGTPQFAPPEQLRGEPLDVRADIYAVGATLYYLLTGRAPFDAPDLRDLFTRVTNEPAVSPRRLRRDIPAPLAAVVLQCLAKTQDLRPASYAELATLLRPFSTSTDRPAALSLRFMAGVVDALLVGAIALVWRTATLNLANASTSELTWTWLLNLAYYLGLEPIWGASLGKRLFALRVRSTSSRPAIAIALRTLIFYAPNLIVAALLMAFPNLPTGLEIERRPGGAGSNWTVRSKPGDLQNGLTFLLTAALFATVRRRNGWAAVHDLATATRVVAPGGVAVRRTSSRAETNVPAPAFKKRRCGPFTVTADLGATPDGQLLAAFDPILRRPVWIHELSG